MKNNILIAIITPLMILYAWHMVTLVHDRFKWTREYGIAESIQPAVWKLSQELKSHHSTSGHLPQNWAASSSDTQVHALAAFEPIYNPSESNIFVLHVNDMFGFFITKEFEPNWIWPQNFSLETQKD